MLPKKTKYKTLIFLALALSIVSCRDQTKVIKQTPVTFQKEGVLKFYKPSSDSIVQSLDIEIAETEYETATGLMYRDGMKNNQGMLFIFKAEKPRYFYMRNTRFPLDIIYLDAHQRIVSFQKNTKPFNEAPLPSMDPAQFVIEVNAGRTDAWHLMVGDSVTFSRQ